MESPAPLSLERSFELARMQNEVSKCNDPEVLRDILKSLLVQHVAQKHYYEQLLKQQWGL